MLVHFIVAMVGGFNNIIILKPPYFSKQALSQICNSLQLKHNIPAMQV